MIYNNILEIEKALKESLKGNFNLNFEENLTQIKKDFLKEKIKQYNIFNLEKHKLNDTQNFIKDDISFKGLLWNDTFNFIEIENKIKEVFKEYSKKDRIKEVNFYLYLIKIFNKNNKPYFSLYDLKKEISQEEIKKGIKNLKEFCLSCYYLKDKYYINKSLSNFKEFLKLLLDVDISFNYEFEKTLKNYEIEINKSNKNIKVKLFKEWLYISFKNKEVENKFKDYLINQSIKRIEGI